MSRSTSEKAERRKQKKLEKLAKLDAKRSELPESVAQNPSLPEFLDGTNYQLIFAQYKHNLCQISELADKEITALIQKLSLITQYNKNSIAGTAIIRDSVYNSGDYKVLFKGLKDDIDMKESQFFGDARIFFYLVNGQPHGETFANYCCIVAVRKEHFKTK